MRTRTFLSLPFTPWSLSLGIHLTFFLALVFLGRNHLLDLTIIDLDLSSASKISMVQSQPPVDEEWQKPQALKHRLPPPPPKPQPKPEPVTAPAPGTVGPGGDTGTGVYKSIAQVSQLPHFINQVKAQYPEAGKRASIEGVVILQVDIDATGAVKKVDLIQGLGYGCDESALAAVQQSTFTPALAGGEPVPVRFRIPYRFKFEY